MSASSCAVNLSAFERYSARQGSHLAAVLIADEPVVWHDVRRDGLNIAINARACLAALLDRRKLSFGAGDFVPIPLGLNVGFSIRTTFQVGACEQRRDDRCYGGEFYEGRYD